LRLDEWINEAIIIFIYSVGNKETNKKGENKIANFLYAASFLKRNEERKKNLFCMWRKFHNKFTKFIPFAFLNDLSAWDFMEKKILKKITNV